jgi:hypothetical protein
VTEAAVPAVEAVAAVTQAAVPAVEAVAAAAGTKAPARAWKSSTWRTRELQPTPPKWYPKWKYRRPTGK